MTAADRKLREQLDTIAQSGRGDDPIIADIIDLLTARGVDRRHATTYAAALAYTGWEQAHRWTVVGHVIEEHHIALDAAVTAVALAAHQVVTA